MVANGTSCVQKQKLAGFFKNWSLSSDVGQLLAWFGQLQKESKMKEKTKELGFLSVCLLRTECEPAAMVGNKIL